MDFDGDVVHAVAGTPARSIAMGFRPFETADGGDLPSLPRPAQIWEASTDAQ